MPWLLVLWGFPVRHTQGLHSLPLYARFTEALVVVGGRKLQRPTLQFSPPRIICSSPLPPSPRPYAQRPRRSTAFPRTSYYQ